MPTSYELEHAPRRANQAKHCWLAKALHDEYINARGCIKCWFYSGGEKLGTHAVTLALVDHLFN